MNCEDDGIHLNPPLRTPAAHPNRQIMSSLVSARLMLVNTVSNTMPFVFRHVSLEVLRKWINLNDGRCAHLLKATPGKLINISQTLSYFITFSVNYSNRQGPNAEQTTRKYSTNTR